MKPLTQEGREFLRALSLPTPWDTVLGSYLEVIETLTEETQNLEETIEERAGSLKETQLLMTNPSVSYYTALTIYAELGEIGRLETRIKSSASSAAHRADSQADGHHQTQSGGLPRFPRQQRPVRFQWDDHEWSGECCVRGIGRAETPTEETPAFTPGRMSWVVSMITVAVVGDHGRDVTTIISR